MLRARYFASFLARAKQTTDWIMFAPGVFVPVLRTPREPLATLEEFIACYDEDYPAPFDLNGMSANLCHDIAACFARIAGMPAHLREIVAQATRVLIESGNPSSSSNVYWTFARAHDHPDVYVGTTWIASRDSVCAIGALECDGYSEDAAIDNSILSAPICTNAYTNLKLQDAVNAMDQRGIKEYRAAYIFPIAVAHIRADGIITLF